MSENKNTIKIYSNGEEINVNVKSKLSFTDMVSFIRTVVGNVVDLDFEMVSYEWKDISIKTNTVAFYTDLVLPEDVIERYDYVNKNDIVKHLIESKVIDVDTYQNILNAIDSQIEYEVQKLIKKSKTDELLDMIISILSKFSEKIDGIDIEEILKILSTAGKIDMDKIVEAVRKSNKNKKRKSKKEEPKLELLKDENIQ